MALKTLPRASAHRQRRKIRLYRPHTGGQREFHASPARFKYLACGRRWGKTLACVNELMHKAWMKPGGTYWWVAPTYEQCEVPWSYFTNMFHGAFSEKGIRKSRWELTLGNGYGRVPGTVIKFKSAEKEANLRGWGLDGLVIDEAGYIKRVVFEESLEPALADKIGWAVCIGTPQGERGWFSEGFNRGLLKLGDEDYDPDYMSLQYASNNRPTFSKKEYERLKKKMPDAVFAQEILGLFINRAGHVYPEWNRYEHVVTPFKIPSNWYVYGGVDFGYTNPFAVSWGAISPDGTIFLIDEHYRSNALMNDHIASIQGRDFYSRVNLHFADPSSPEHIGEMSRRGISVAGAENDVLVGINTVAERLKANKIKVFDTCRSTIKEFENYMWEPEKRGYREDAGTEKPMKSDDHLMDAVRYMCMGTRFSNPTSPVRRETEIERKRRIHDRSVRKRSGLYHSQGPGMS